MRISTLPTMISRPVATRSPTTEALWRGSGRVGTVTPCRWCALRVPRQGWGPGADRDRDAELRDRGAEGRDALARLHDLDDDADASREDILLRAERDRARAAADRAKAADDRARAAGDRDKAAGERAEAFQDRLESAERLKSATTDELTGALNRKLGLEVASRELERAHRTGTRLVLAFVDVDGLKAVNDSRGHLAGDALLQRVGETLRAHVRAYDTIVR